MDSSTSTRFRFRDHQEIGESSDSDTSSGISSLSSGRDDEDEPESMTGKGIKRLCSELLELKRSSDEDFHQNIFSNYAAFVRIFEDVEGIENELMQLRNQVSTQKRLVKDLIDGIYLKVFSKENINSIIEEPVCAESHVHGKLEAHTNEVLETLDILLSEHRLDEALDILEVEAVKFKMIQMEGNFPPDVSTFYNSAISERRALLEIQLMLVAENPRVSAPELQKALVGLCRFGNSHLATQLLLKYYHSRLATGIHDLQCSKSQCSKSFLHGVYIRDLSKFVFSMISQAARSFVLLYGESSPHASELIQWACEETEAFASCFNKYVKSISEISVGLSTAVEAVKHALSYCSLLEAQKIVLRPCLIKHIRPSMDEVLWIHINHFKKVIGIFTAIDVWAVGRYLISGILDEGCSSMLGGQQPEYCLLTSSGRKFVTLLQAITEDISPLLALQMEGSILRGLKDLFMEYIVLLEKAITCETNGIEKSGSRINLAESLPQQVSVIANTSILVHFYSSIVRSIVNTVGNCELKKNMSVSFQQKELDNYMLHIQKACSQLRAHFGQQLICKMMSVKDSWRDALGNCVGDQTDPKILHDAMPSVVFQVLFSELSKLEEFSEDNVVDVDWLMDLLRELMEAILVWISDDKEFWTTIDEKLTVQYSNGFKQFALDMQFLVEIARHGGYLSQNITYSCLSLVSRMESALLSAGLDPKRDADNNEWAINAAADAIQKLLEIEKTNLFEDEEPIGTLEERPSEGQPESASDSSQDDAGSYSEDVIETEDLVTMTASEAANKGSLCISEEDDGGVNDGSAITIDPFNEVEDLGTKNVASSATDGLQDIKETKSVAILPVRSIIAEDSETRVMIEENTISNERDENSVVRVQMNEPFQICRTSDAHLTNSA